MKYLACLWITFLSLASKAQGNLVLEGTLGKAPIVMTMDAPMDEGGEIRYYYLSQLRDIVLLAERYGDTSRFSFTDPQTGHVQERFTLNRKGNGFTGLWQGKSGKKLPVDLHRASGKPYISAAGGVRTPALEKDNLYDFIRAQRLAFKQDSVSTFQGKSFEWSHETHGKTPFFRLGNGFSADEKALLNPLLDSLHVDMALDQLGCASRFSYSEGNGIGYDISIGYLSDDLLGFSITSYFDCGGAHPDFGTQGYLIDRHNGKSYDINDVLAFDTSVTTEAKSGFEPYAAYQEHYFAPKVMKLADDFNHFPAVGENDGDCDYHNLEYWGFPSWEFHSGGVMFTPHFYRAARNCDVPFLVPFVMLRPFKNPDFPYSF